jgi:energy-coupling factor transporter ATP-binding protein EcfA2
MSYVPQDDIVHAQLTVREALYFSAKLRTDLTDAEIEERIDKVLISLEIHDKKNTIIGSPERKVLSGGQRKRVNIAMELIAAAPVILLDEPTSGLSSYDAENVVRVLKTLSKQGTTIITTIHQPSLDIFKQFDSLIMISRDRGGCGALAYFGPAYPDAIEFFDPAAARKNPSEPGKDLTPELLLSGLAQKTTSDWVTTYEGSLYQKSFVTDRAGKTSSTPDDATETAVRQFGFDQWWTLVRRNFILKTRDRGQAIITIIQAPAFAILLGLVFRSLNYTAMSFAHCPPAGPCVDETEWYTTIKHAIGIEFLMVVAAIWFGCNNVARDIVGEWTVFQRERMVCLKLPSYVFSKLFVAAILNLFQCLTLLGIVKFMCDLQGDFLITLAILYLSSLVGSAIGLCVSARTPTTEAAIAMLPLILLPMIVLGGGLTPINGMPVAIQQIAKIVPSRWAFEANLLLEARKDHNTSGSVSVESDRSVSPTRCDLAYEQFPDGDRCRDNQSPPHGLKRESIRTSLPASFAILGGMLVFWLGVALVFLRMRDIQ